jgi:hypothetical protein
VVNGLHLHCTGREPSRRQARSLSELGVSRDKEQRLRKGLGGQRVTTVLPRSAMLMPRSPCLDLWATVVSLPALLCAPDEKYQPSTTHRNRAMANVDDGRYSLISLPPSVQVAYPLPADSSAGKGLAGWVQCQFKNYHIHHFSKKFLYFVIAINFSTLGSTGHSRMFPVHLQLIQ